MKYLAVAFFTAISPISVHWMPVGYIHVHISIVWSHTVIFYQTTSLVLRVKVTRGSHLQARFPFFAQAWFGKALSRLLAVKIYTRQLKTLLHEIIRPTWPTANLRCVPRISPSSSPCHVQTWEHRVSSGRCLNVGLWLNMDWLGCAKIKPVKW